MSGLETKQRKNRKKNKKKYETKQKRRLETLIDYYF